MHLRLLPEKGKYKFRGVKMEMLVTKFSNGKYRNEGELFAEPISDKNVKLMGEMIALQALRTVKKFDLKVADRYYIGLIKDLHHMGEVAAEAHEFVVYFAITGNFDSNVLTSAVFSVNLMDGMSDELDKPPQGKHSETL